MNVTHAAGAAETAGTANAAAAPARRSPDPRPAHAPFVWTDAAVRRALFLPGGDASTEHRGISTDTRTLRRGDVFVALAGERFDGHAFLPQAVAAGCAAVVADRELADCPVPVHRVGDTLRALGDLALHRRLELDAGPTPRFPVVAITGSSGKTTVKDLVLGALSPALSPHGTSANENNRVGTPLTILSTPPDAGALVLEVGTNEPGEIAELARIARPTIAVVTTVSETHVERLGSFEGVLDEKLDLLRGLAARGRAVVGDRPAVLASAAKRIAPGAVVAGWSERADADLRPAGARIRSDGTYAFEWMGHPVALRMPGAHNVYNAMLALTVARLLGVDARRAAEGVSRVTPGVMRGEVRALSELTLLVDCYNANAAGIEAAVRTLEAMEVAGRRIAVLGTMLELGDRSAAIHRETLQRVLLSRIDRCVVIGDFARAAPPHDERVLALDTVEELVERLPGYVRPGDAVLLKASRGVRLERVIDPLEQRFGGV